MALTGVTPGQREYEIWADENDTLTIIKTKSLEPEAVNPNVIVVKLSGWVDDEVVEDDW